MGLTELSLAALAALVSVNAELYLLPENLRLVFPSSTGAVANVASFDACASKAASTLTKGFIAYDASENTCMYAERINGYIFGESTIKPAAFDNQAVTPVTSKDSTETERYIMEEVYGNSECPPTTTLVGQFCQTTIPNKFWGYYIAAHFPNNTILVLTKSKVNESLCYKCDTADSVKMIFGNQWFCYSRHAVTQPSYNTIAGNACKNFVAGSSVIKFTEIDRECGFLNEIRETSIVYVGIVLPSGTTKSATAFKYFDGTSPGALPWVPGRPNSNSSYNLVYCDVVRWGSVTDWSPVSLDKLFCKKPAQKIACPTSSTTGTTVATTTWTVATTTTTPGVKGCDAGWTKFEDSCYIYAAAGMTSTQAQDKCEELGGYLPSVHTAAQNQFLLDFSNDPSHDTTDCDALPEADCEVSPGCLYACQLWLGLQHDGVEWAWTDATTVDYTNWGVNGNQSEPNDYLDDECVQMYNRLGVGGSQLGQWNDVGCDIPMLVVCETPTHIVG